LYSTVYAQDTSDSTQLLSDIWGKKDRLQRILINKFNDFSAQWHWFFHSLMMSGEVCYLNRPKILQGTNACYKLSISTEQDTNLPL